MHVENHWQRSVLCIVLIEGQFNSLNESLYSPSTTAPHNVQCIHIHCMYFSTWIDETVSDCVIKSRVKYFEWRNHIDCVLSYLDFILYFFCLLPFWCSKLHDDWLIITLLSPMMWRQMNRICALLIIPIIHGLWIVDLFIVIWVFIR